LFSVLIVLFVFSSFLSVPFGYAAPGVGYYPSGYNLLGSTAYVSGSLSDLQSDNGAYMTFRSYPFAFSTTSYSRATIGYRSNTGTNFLSSPKTRSWSGTAWDASETQLPTAGSPVRFVRVAYSTVAQYYDYKIAVVLSDDGTLDAYVYNGTSWIVTNNLADLWTTAPTGDQRPYDIAFETSSGNALLVYAWFDDTTNDLAYRRWFASNQSWGPQVLLDDSTETTEVDFSFVILDNDKTSGSNYIGLIALVQVSSDALTAVWNGSSWGSMTDLSTGVSMLSEEDIGLAWAYDGSLMAVSGEGANEVVRWNRWTKTGGWGTSSTFDMDTSQTLVTNWITLKADPVTDDLMLIMIDSGSDLHSGYWNGATWSITSNIDTAVDTNAQRPADFEWEPTGSRGLLVRGTSSGVITWRRWTTGTGWSADTSPSMGTYTHPWVQLRRNPRNVAGDVKILGAVLESTVYDLGAIKWDGTTFTVIGSSTFTGETTVITYEGFDLDFQNFGDPTEFTSEVEFTGTSNTQPLSRLVWTVDSSWTVASVTVTMQLYNYNLGQYPTSGDGYISYISSATPNTDETRNQTITTNPANFRDSLGNWRIKVKGVKSALPRFNFRADLVKFEASYDTTPPTWTNAGTNNTIAGQPTRFYVRWTDNAGLSGFIFGTNNTGRWANDTWTPMSGTTNWSNVTKTLNSTATVVQWRIWANDTSNNWNDTGILSIRVLHFPMASFTYSPSTPDTGETATFDASSSYDPDGSIVSYFWTFGDGTNSTGMIATHAYVDNGVYTVTLRVTDNDGLTDTDSKAVTVLNRPPVASFTESATTVPTGTPIYFNASSSYDPDGSIASYFWTFGDGTNATGVTVSHAYADNGVYTVTLTVTDNDSATASTSATKTVLNRSPIASFTESAETVYTGQAITFDASASYDPDGSIISYLWTFGDGTNASGVSVSHAYSDNGIFTVTLIVTDNDGATATVTATKTVLNRTPVASFTESATTVYKDEVIHFNASTSYDPDGFIVSYFWTFGDGTNATGVTADHTYPNVGTYTVTLTVTDNDGATASTSAVKTVLSRPPVASFTESTTTVLTGEFIYFNASTSYDPDGTIVSYFWTFGDGTNASGVSVSHAYVNNGIYTVTLTVTDSDGATGTATATKTVLNRPPVASFTESATTVLTGELIYFNASASYDLDGTIVSYFWTFGDGTNAAGVTVSHAYSNNGVYTVTLTVTDDDGATATANAIKTVLNRAPTASFTESATTVYRGEVIHFNASASFDPDGSIVSYFWSFGDGTNATGMLVDHAYTNIGTYTVTLTVTDDDGATGTATATKTVLNRSPVAEFTESTTLAYTGEVIYFNASGSYDSDGSIVSYFWTFGDGSTASGVTVSHAYSENGVYTVTLTVTDNEGAVGTKTATKTILNRPPIAAFTESATTVLTGEVIHFNASASYDPDGSIVSYFWNFGDGTNATGIIVDHAYVENGVYTVTLTVTDNDGATATTIATKTVLNRAPVASFTESATTVLTRESITFNASLSYDPDGTIVSFTWNFGDGNITTVTSSIITHSYADNGTYTVTLTVTDNDGATNSASAVKTVLNRAPVAIFTESATTVYTKETITFNATGSYDLDGSIVSFTWNFGDGNITIVTSPTITHAYSDNGTYTVTLTVKDNDGATASSSSIKTVLNRAPVAVFTESATTVYTNEVIYFNASASYDLDGSIISYVWTFGDGTNANGVAVSHAYSENGIYTVTLTITDNDGATATTTAVKTVLNRLPVASFTENATTVYTGVVIRFDASASYDPDGSIVSFFWTFGDGTSATGVVVYHAYADNGVYTATLTVTDNDGGTASTSATKTILNRAPAASFTESATTVLTGEVIYFNASSSYDLDGTIVSYFWTFGDGTNATGVTVSHAYADNGVYTVTLRVTDNDSATSSTSATKTVLNRSPAASFTESAEYVYTGEPITLNASSSHDQDGFIVSYFWTFGDGNTATGIVVSHAYADNGVYTVTLTITDNDGATATASAVKTVGNRPPIATFTESATTVLTNEIIYLNASGSSDSDGFIVSYFWEFGDGANATGVTTSHAYVENGVYTVKLTVTDNDGAKATTTATKTVLNRAPVAAFTESATNVLTGEIIHFNASASYDPDGSIVSYFWNFGDGTNATGVTVDHAYSDNGVYTVILTVTDNDGATASVTATKTVSNRPPIASFSESATTVLTGEIIRFNASSSYDVDGSIVSYFWTFGDGANGFGVVIDHSYADNGVYTVTLTVTDNDGATATATAVKTVLNRPPVASFTESATTVDTGQIIYFNASSSYDLDGSIVSYFWDFGDGKNATGVATQHAYVENGVYAVTLTVTDNDGAKATATATKYVQNRPPVASFTYSPSFPIVGETVVFNASASYDPDGTISSYRWNFGDGNVTTVTVPTIIHVYNAFGNYTVSLTLTDNDGSTSTTTQVVRIRQYPIAAFTYSPSFPIVSETVTFDASSSNPNGGVITSYLWNFGDGTTQSNTTNSIITHVYSAFGNYTITLAVGDSERLTGSTTGMVRVRDYPSANFTFSPSYPIERETVTFDASSSTPNGGLITNYQWNFGDGNITTMATPTITHAYSAIGTYTVTLTVTDSEGLSGSQSKIVSVRGYPVAIFSFSPTAPYVGDTVTFDASLSSPNGGVISSYSWNFGDGTPIYNTTNPITTHVYALAGNRTVTLAVTDSEGLSDIEMHSIVVAKAPVASFTHAPQFPKVGETVTFNASASYDPNGYVVSYRWDFGDGNMTTVTTPIITHAYTSTGAYTVALTVTDNGGYTDTATGTVTLGTPKASFICMPIYPIAEQSITFNASGSYDPNGYIVSYVWNFGDGNITTLTAPIIIHVYGTSGNYTVALTVADNQGLTDTTTRVVSVGKAPVASFTYAPAVPYVGDTVTFDASSSTPSSGSITSYAWNFGDGSPLVNTTSPTTSHKYTAAGNYTVSLTIKDSVGLTNTATKTITVLQSPVAIFTHSPTYPQALDTVTFNASASYDANGYIVSYVWNFGDGNITTVTNSLITHVYNKAGNYTVVLIISDNEGYTHSNVKSVFVSMRPPVANFVSAPSSPIALQTVTFDASSSYDLDGTITSYIWNFGDGNTTTVATTLITHRYSAAGNYTVTLTVTDNDGLINTKTALVSVRDYPTAAFSYSPSIPDVGSTVTFDASSSAPNGGAIVSYVWNFGDGSPLTNTTNPIVTHIFSASGSYTVTLTVTDSEGLSDTETKVAYIAELPTALFTYSPTSPYMGDTVTFNASQSYDVDGYIVSYVWNFGDGTPQVNTTNPITTHIYIVGGSYTISLTVRDNLGLSDAATLVVNVGKAPVAVFTYKPDFPIASETVTFDASSSYDARRPIANYTWNFGDGNIFTVTTPVVTHVYANEGSYTVSLKVTDTGGYADTTSQTVRVRNYPIASFTYSPSYPIKGQDATFDASASQPRGGVIVSYLWDFGDGTPPINVTSPVTKHKYNAVGQYNVTLTVTDSEGLTSTASKTLKVRDYPTADFIWSPPFPVATQSVTFDASSSKANSGTITGYMWDLGDGTIRTGSSPTLVHVYSRAKNYTVTLTVINSEGLSSSVSKIVTVLDAPPIASFTYSPTVSITGQATTFDASGSYDPDGSITSYRWDFGDGNITTVATAIIYHVYASAGNVTVTLTVTDNAGLTVATAQTLKIVTYPTASFAWSPEVPGSTVSVTFDASASTPNSGVIVSYSWNFGDGNSTTVTQAIIVHRYSIKGSYTVVLTVSNSEGLSNSQSKVITVVGTPPVANFVWQPATPPANETVTFDASSSLARGGIITNYRWDFGDGNSIPVSFKPTATHKFTASGQYTVTLTVTDSEGLSDTKSKILSVAAPPQADFTWSPSSPQTYQIITFDASASTPNGGTITNYSWNFGDGNITAVGNPIITHVYTASGIYTVTLTVTDSEGLSGATSKSIVVTGATGPQADFTYSPSTPYVFEAIIFNASASTPGTGSIIDYTWNFGDGNITSAVTPIIIHAYQASGNYTATLTVTNVAGLKGTKSQPVSVLPISGPKADFTWSPSVPQPNKTVTLDASISTPGWDGSTHPPIISWRWDFGDGNISIVTEPIVIHVYNASRDYLVTLSVMDAQGSIGSTTKTVKVTSLLGDLNGDGKVDIKDIAIVAKAFGSTPGSPTWNPIADVDGNGKVEIKDIAIVAKQYGQRASSLFIPWTRTLFTSYSFLRLIIETLSLLTLATVIANGVLFKRKRTYYPLKPRLSSIL